MIKKIRCRDELEEMRDREKRRRVARRDERQREMRMGGWGDGLKPLRLCSMSLTSNNHEARRKIKKGEMHRVKGRGVAKCYFRFRVRKKHHIYIYFFLSASLVKSVQFSLIDFRL